MNPSREYKTSCDLSAEAVEGCNHFDKSVLAACRPCIMIGMQKAFEAGREMEKLSRADNDARLMKERDEWRARCELLEARVSDREDHIRRLEEEIADGPGIGGRR